MERIPPIVTEKSGRNMGFILNQNAFDVLMELAKVGDKGLSRREIWERLNMAPSTFNDQISRLLKRNLIHKYEKYDHPRKGRATVYLLLTDYARININEFWVA